MTAEAPSGHSERHTFEARCAKARIVAGLMHAGLMSTGKIVVRLASDDNADEMIGCLCHAEPKDRKDELLSYSGIVSSFPQSNLLTQQFLWLDPKDIALTDEILGHLSRAKQVLADTARSMARRPWSHPSRNSLANDPAVDTDVFPRTFPITFGVGLAETGANEHRTGRVSISLHRPRRIDVPDELFAAIRALSGDNFAFDQRALGLPALDVPSQFFRDGRAEILRPGFSISRQNGQPSSICLFVKTDENKDIYILGSGHGLSNYGTNLNNPAVIFVSTDHRGRHREIGNVTAVHFVASHRASQFIDVALAKLNPSVEVSHIMSGTSERLRSPARRKLSTDDPIRVVGCNTGARDGDVARTEVDIDMVAPGGRVYRYVNQFECKNSVVGVGRAGDSGGLITTRAAQVAGQITGWLPSIDKDPSTGGVIATPIQTILAGLKLAPYQMEP